MLLAIKSGTWVLGISLNEGIAKVVRHQLILLMGKILMERMGGDDWTERCLDVLEGQAKTMKDILGSNRKSEVSEHLLDEKILENTGRRGLVSQCSSNI